MDRGTHQKPQPRRQVGDKEEGRKGVLQVRNWKNIQVRVPVYFGSHRAIMAVDVVDVRIPLLISLAAMKKANTVIYPAMDIATIEGI